MTLIESTLKSYIIPYLNKLHPTKKFTEKNTFSCPCNCSEKNTAQILNDEIHCHNCSKILDIFDLVRTIKSNFKNSSNEEISEYLIHLFKLNVKNDEDLLLHQYFKAGFYLFPLSPNSKIPIKDFKWKEEATLNIEVWKSWLARGYGLGLKLGKDSKVIAIDIDSDSTWEKIKNLFDITLIQTTKRGKHFLYNYDKDFDLINHDNLRDKGFDMEVRANNSYIVIAPTSVEGEKRTWNNQKITNIPLRLKEFLFVNINKDKSRKSEDEKIQEAINNNDLGTAKLKGWDGCRNDNFVKLGGMLRKKLNIEETEFALSIFNSALEKQLPSKEIKAMVDQLNKYQTYDKEGLAKTILERLEIIKEASAFQLSKTLNLAQKDIEDVLSYLEKEGKIVSLGSNRYRRLEQVEWSDNLEEESKPIDFVCPYFYKYGFFNWKEMIVIGGMTGQGKTVIVANIVKKLAEQQKVPYIISTESTSTIGKTFHKLGVSKGQFKYKVIKSALDVEFPDNAIVIIDWLGATDGEFAKIGAIYHHLYEQIKKHNCFLIVFEQLRKDNNKFFAQNLNSFYASLVASYHYGENGKDHINTYFQTHKIRDSKTGVSFITIPCTYNPENREIKLKDE